MNRTYRIIAVAALMFALLAATAIAWSSHVNSVYDRKDDTYRLLAIKTDRNETKMRKLHAAEIATVKTDDAAALKLAVKKQRNHDQRVLKRAARRLKAAYKRQAEAARVQGYSAGSSAGFSNGHDAGLHDGSDDLACSDDPDVTWLPSCFFFNGD